MMKSRVVYIDSDPTHPMTLGVLRDWYLGLEKVRRSKNLTKRRHALMKIAEVLGPDRPISALREEHILEYRRKRMQTLSRGKPGKTLAPSTVNSELSWLDIALMKAHECGKLSLHPDSQAQDRKVALGDISREELPYPLVYYPGLYGAFFAYAKDEQSKPVLCICNEEALYNLSRLLQRREAEKRGLAGAYEGYLPNIVVQTLMEWDVTSAIPVTFEKGVCHWCNGKTPSLSYCLEMYGTRFIQSHGWFVNQTFLGLGILPDGSDYPYLETVCPENLVQEINRYRQMQLERQEKCESAFPHDKPSRSMSYKASCEVQKLEAKAQKQRSVIHRLVENEARTLLGFKRIGEGWDSETLLRQILERIFSGESVEPHARPDWLQGLELDAYIPALALAFEYQGEQHYMPVAAFGGAEGLKRVRDRDLKKRSLCAEKGVQLIEVRYDEPLTEEYVLALLNKNGYFKLG